MNVDTPDFAAPTSTAVDPFAFWPGWRSRIAGLGGSEPPEQSGYAFHSPYVRYAPGDVHFVVRFAELQASSGSLLVSVYALPHDGGVARVERTVQMFLADFAVLGEARLRIEASPHADYAILGTVSGETDARAAGLSIEATAAGTDTLADDLSEALIEARATVFGAPSIRRATTLISHDKATLADPVSQMCTADQFAEPAYALWLDRLKRAPHLHRKQWEFVYILQALDRYGMLQPGARGVGFGVGTEPLPAMMAAMGCTVVATDLAADDDRSAAWNATQQHGSSVDNLLFPEICPEAEFRERVSFQPADMNAIPDTLRGFDFTWSSCAYEHLGSIAQGLRFVEESIACLKPGGVAVHTTELNLTSNDKTLDNMDTVLFRRRDVEQLAVRLVSQGHQVAQIKYDPGDRPLDNHVDVPPYASDPHLKLAISAYVTTSFGLIVRKGG